MVMYALECHEDGAWGAGRCGYACTHHPRRPPRGCLRGSPLHHHRHRAGARCLVQLLRKLWEPDVAKAEGGVNARRGMWRTHREHSQGWAHSQDPRTRGHMHRTTRTMPQRRAQMCSCEAYGMRPMHTEKTRGTSPQECTRTHPMDTPYASNILNSSPLVDSSSPSPRPNAANRSPRTGVCCRKKMRARGTWDRSGYTGGSVLPGRDPVRQEESREQHSEH